MFTSEDHATPDNVGPLEGAPGDAVSSRQPADESLAVPVPSRQQGPEFSAHLVLLKLQAGLIGFDKRFDSLVGSGTPSAKIGPELRATLSATVTSLTGDGGDFASAIAEIRRRCLAAAPENHPDPTSDSKAALDARMREMDSRSLLAALDRVEKVHELLGISDREEMRRQAIESLSSKTMGLLRAELNGLALTRLVATQVAVALADRTLDVAPLVSILKSASLYRVGIQMAQEFEVATHPDLALGFAVLPYAAPERVAAAREEVRTAIWKAAIRQLNQQNESLFHFGFSSLCSFGAEAIPQLREFFRRVNAPHEGEHYPQWNTIRAALMAVSLMGEKAFAPFIQPGPNATIEREPRSIIEDILILTSHPDDRIQELAFKFLRVMASDDIRVQAKFLRLGNQIEELPRGVVRCVISMNPVERLLEWAEKSAPFVRAEAILALIGIEKRLGEGCSNRIVTLLDKLQLTQLTTPLDPVVAQALATRSKSPPPPAASA